MDRINSLVGITQTVRTANVATVESQPKTTTETKTGFDTYSKVISASFCVPFFPTGTVTSKAPSKPGGVDGESRDARHSVI